MPASLAAALMLLRGSPYVIRFQLAFIYVALGAGVLAGGVFFLSIHPRSRISQYAFNRKQPDSVSKISVMKRPSTVAENGQRPIMPLTKIHTTPAKGSTPSTRESTRIMGRKLPPLFLFFFGT